MARAPLSPLALQIDDALPQTQCTRCDYPDCAAYAEAIALDGAAINRCPPGGAEGVARLAALTGRPAAPLDPDCGAEGPRLRAVVDEAWCIGCTKCLDACPTDAIVGASKRMHTVIDAHCTGCALCVPVCPVDCIALVDASGPLTGWQAWSQAQADAARSRYAAHKARRERAPPVPVRAPVPALMAGVVDGCESAPAPPPPVPGDEGARRRALVAAALARARAARAT